MKKLALIFTGILINIAAFAQNSSILLSFDNIVGSQDLKLNSEIYTNAADENFTVSLFQYYISNIKLKATDGSEYIVPQDESYFLVRETNPESQKIRLNNIPQKKYIGISFMIGIDSLRNTMPVSSRKGCLDVGGEGQDMYWAWNSGYIFMKIEGSYADTKADSILKTQKFLYHIGLFGGMKNPTVNNIRVINLLLNKKLKIKKNELPEITIGSDILKIFGAKTQIKIADKPSIMVTPSSKNIADNYAEMFRVVKMKIHKKLNY